MFRTAAISSSRRAHTQGSIALASDTGDADPSLHGAVFSEKTKLRATCCPGREDRVTVINNSQALASSTYSKT